MNRQRILTAQLFPIVGLTDRLFPWTNLHSHAWELLRTTPGGWRKAAYCCCCGFLLLHFLTTQHWLLDHRLLIQSYQTMVFTTICRKLNNIVGVLHHHFFCKHKWLQLVSNPKLEEFETWFTKGLPSHCEFRSNAVTTTILELGPVLIVLGLTVQHALTSCYVCIAGMVTTLKHYNTVTVFMGTNERKQNEKRNTALKHPTQNIDQCDHLRRSPRKTISKSSDLQL